MNYRLIYVVGPSGAGKDSLMRWLRERSAGWLSLHWARRSVTRVAHESSECDISVDACDFEKTDQAGGFALQWQANGVRYGIRHEELVPLSKQKWVFLNGSRAYLQACADRYPGLTILHITADPAILRQRLQQRARETQVMVEERIQRAPALVTPVQSLLLEVFNNSDIDEAGQQMLQQLECLPGWSGKEKLA